MNAGSGRLAMDLWAQRSRSVQNCVPYPILSTPTIGRLLLETLNTVGLVCN